MKRLSIALAFAAFGLIIWAPSVASAHAALAASNPESNSKIEMMPGEVSLTLNEPIQNPAFISVMAEDGSRVNSQTVEVQDKTATSAITKLAAAGKYKMNYRVVSTDGHPVTGTLEFEVLQRATPTPTPVPSATSTPSVPSAEADEAASASSGSSATRDALTIIGFTVVAMGALVLLLRAGLKSAPLDDDID